ncbi:hypothetical protein pdam_00021615, partial [Pocillopora damicornis]
FISTNLYDDT